MTWTRSGVAAIVAVAWMVSGAPLLGAAPVAEAQTAPGCTITGTFRGEVLRGSAGDDVICGLGGDDRLVGGGGDDVLFGGDGRDVLLGGSGHDLLRGGPHRDVMHGGSGDDSVRGGSGADTVQGGSGADWLRGSQGGDRLAGGPGRDVVAYMPRAAPLRLSIGDGANDGVRGERDDIAADVEDLRGGSGNDVLIGSGRRNRLFGLSGNDRVIGRGGDDVITGGAGTDVIDGRDGASFVDELRCGAGAGDQALADMTDTIAGGCEVVVQNDPPTAVTLTPASVEENEPVGTLVGTLTATDPDLGDRHTFTLVTGTGSANNGSFTIAGSQLRTRAVFDFETDNSYSIRVRATDTEGAVFDQPLTITVVDADEPPVAVDDTAAPVAEDAAATPIDVLANDTDIDGGPMVIDAVSQPANGTVTNGGTDLSYQPDPDFCGADSFTYTLNGGSIGTVTVTVTCVDDVPVAVNDTATVTEDDPATTVDVLANDVDPEDDPITIATVTQPANGTVVITNGGDDLTYQPDPDFCGADTFTYTLSPGGSTATVNVTVTCVNDPPIAVDDTFTTDEDTDLELSTSGPDSPAENDTDVDGDPLTVAEVSGPAGGTVTLAAGTVTFTPTADLCGAATGGFTYMVSDGNGGTDAGQVTVDITCVDDPPVAVNDNPTVSEDAAATAVDVLANDTDIDGGPKTITAASDPANGTVVLTGGTPGARTGLTYQPDPNYCNNPPGTTPDTFTYTLNGGDSATVAVTVTCVDDAPVAVNDTATVAEDDPATTVDVLANDVDADSVGLTIDTVTQPANGAVVITNEGDDLTYQPDANYCNNPPGTTPDTFTYTLSGGSSATVAVTVTCVDDAPVAVNDTATVTEDAAATAVDVLANDTDIDGGPKTITAASDPANGTVVLTGGTPGAHTGLTYRPDPNYCNNPPGTTPDTFTYTLNGGSSATVAVTVTCVDDAPVAVNDTATVTEDAAATAVDVLANDTDIDGGPKTITAASDPANGTVTLTGGGTGLTYQPAANYCNNPPGTTPDTFTYTLNGGSTATVSMTVTCVNDPPVADDETFTGAIGNTVFVVDDPSDGAPNPTALHNTISGDILAGDTDVDGPGPLVVQAGTFATTDGGSVTIEADGDFVFTPAAGTSCTDTSDGFTYTVSDQNAPTAGIDTGQVTITIANCVWYVSNNAPGNAGTSAAPFDTLAQAETASAAGHTIFVFDGDNTTTGYAAGFTLKANQRLIGEAATLAVGTVTLHTGNPAARPTISDNGADVIDLASGDTVTGIGIDPQGAGGGIAGGTGDAGGTITDVTIADTSPLGNQPGLELNATSGTWNISTLTVNTNGAVGVSLTNAGTINLATTTITTAGARGLEASGATTNFGTASVIGAITVTGSSTGAVSLTATTGTLNLGDGAGTDLALTTTSGATAALFSTHTGTLTVDAAGTDNVSATGGPALDITGPGTFDFDDVDSTNSSTDGINLDNFGTGSVHRPLRRHRWRYRDRLRPRRRHRHRHLPRQPQQRQRRQRRDHRPQRWHRHPARSDQRHQRRRRRHHPHQQHRWHHQHHQRHQDPQHHHQPRRHVHHQQRPHVEPHRRQPRHRHHQRPRHQRQRRRHDHDHRHQQHHHLDHRHRPHHHHHRHRRQRRHLPKHLHQRRSQRDRAQQHRNRGEPGRNGRR